MKKTLCIFLSALILFSVVNPTIASAKKQTQFLSEAKMLEDYDTMWNIIEENYPYMGVAARVTGNDFNNVKNTYRQYIIGNTTKIGFKEIINSCLSQFRGTGHMSMIFNDSTYAYNLEVNKGYSGHCKLIYDALNNKVSRQFYNYKQTNNKKETENTSGKVGVFSNTVNFTTKEYDDIQTSYIKIPTFKNPQMNISALKQYFNEIADYKNCIIDLRGNMGGSDNYWYNGIVEPNLKEDISVSYYALAKGNLSKKYIESDNDPCFSIKNFDYSKLTNIKLDDVTDMEYYYERKENYKKASNPLFKGNFYVLTDKSNYSAAEGFIQFCKRTGFAKLIGETTSGDGMGKDPMIVALPNSGICLQFSTAYTLNKDGSSNEEKGTQPDMEYSSLDFCLDLIKGKK